MEAISWRDSRREACEVVADTLADEIMRLERLGRRREEREAAEAQIQQEIALSQPRGTKLHVPSTPRRHDRLLLHAAAAAGGRRVGSGGAPERSPLEESASPLPARDASSIRVAAWVAETSPRREACEEVADTLADMLHGLHRAASTSPTRPRSPGRRRAATPGGLSMEWAVRVDAALNDLAATQRANAGKLRRQVADVELDSINTRRWSPARSASSPTAAGHEMASATSLPLASEFPISPTASRYYISPLTGTAVPTTSRSPPVASSRRSVFSGAALRASRSTSEPQRWRTSPLRVSDDRARRAPQPFLSIDLQSPGAASSAEIRAQLHSSLQTTPLSTLSRLSERRGSVGDHADNGNGYRARGVFSASASSSSNSSLHTSGHFVERGGRLHRYEKLNIC